MSYYIASLKHTSNWREHITFWKGNHCGYALAVVDGHIGEYTAEEAARLNDGCECIAVPVESVKALLSPEPYFRNSSGVAARFYDTPGPVVDNTRANWNALIAASLTEGRSHKPKPVIFRKKRRSFAITDGGSKA